MFLRRHLKRRQIDCLMQLQITRRDPVKERLEAISQDSPVERVPCIVERISNLAQSTCCLVNLNTSHQSDNHALRNFYLHFRRLSCLLL